jgi:hypothetical protein
MPCHRTALQPNHSHFLAPALLCTGAYNLPKTKGLSSHWWPIIQLETQALGVLVSSHCCSFLGLQTPLAHWVLSLAPSLGALCSIQEITVSIHFSICQGLAKPHKIELYKGPVSKILLAYATMSGFGGCLWDGSPRGTVSGWSFHLSQLWTLTLYLLSWVFCSPFYEGTKYPHFGLPSSWISCVFQIVSWVY